MVLHLRDESVCLLNADVRRLVASIVAEAAQLAPLRHGGCPQMYHQHTFHLQISSFNHPAAEHGRRVRAVGGCLGCLGLARCVTMMQSHNSSKQEAKGVEMQSMGNQSLGASRSGSPRQGTSARPRPQARWDTSKVTRRAMRCRELPVVLDLMEDRVQSRCFTVRK